MDFFRQILSLKNWLALRMTGAIAFSSMGQNFITETPTGKVSVFVTPSLKDSTVFEFRIINTSEEVVGFNPIGVNNSYIQVVFPDGTETKDYLAGYWCGSGDFYERISPKTYRSWQISIPAFFEQVGKYKKFEDGLYQLSWKVRTSVGTLTSEPIDFYLEDTK